MSGERPGGASVAIVGGGVLGCSIAWYLARRGVSDIVVLERNDIGSGATSRSAGLVARGRLHAPTLALVARTRVAMDELESQLDERVGFRRVGSVRVASTEARETDLARMDGLLARSGVAVRNIDAAEARRLVPWLDASGARRISHVEDDGYVDAYQLASGYARAARALGVRIRTRVAVEGFLREGGRIAGVRTSEGEIRADAVVDAAGAWAVALAMEAGHALGTAPVRSHYYITAPQPGWPREHPIVYLPDARAYARPEVGGLLVGVQEPMSRTYDGRELPPDIADFPLATPADDWDVLTENAPMLRPYIPDIDRLPLAHHITGLSTYTPDGRFILGAAGPSRGYFVAGGCCGTGVSASGGIGEALACAVTGEAPPVDLADFSPQRFGAIDPFGESFRESCAAARAGKLRRG